jgi:hypothetical protein|tara:strand:+ start:2948 stop:3163 length:216 start_codon:yes stop_codon:yes gene_type:complete
MAMIGTKENPVEAGKFYRKHLLQNATLVDTIRWKLPRGWLIYDSDCMSFVPFSEDGTGWGRNDPADLVNDR